jgi:hypothetical protein
LNSGDGGENVQRAWPFEDRVDPPPPIRTPDDFLRRHGREADAIVVRIGLNGAELVLVAQSGAWERWVMASVDDAKMAAESLALPVHVGEFPDEVRVRMNAYRRSADDFARGAYPEQGRVGPVSPYPENRPRRTSAEEERQAPSR